MWLALALTCLLGAMAPGPSLLVVLNATLAGGRPAGLLASWAHAVGVACYALLTVLGLSLLVANSAPVFLSLQACGALYLIWLAINNWRGGSLPATAGDQSEDSTSLAHSRRSAVRNGFLIAFLNPKLAIFMLALFSQFLSADASAAQRAIMVATAGIIDGGWYSAVVLLAGGPAAMAWLRQRARGIGRLLAVVLLLLGTTVLWQIARQVGG